jgi:hypothetical protein
MKDSLHKIIEFTRKCRDAQGQSPDEVWEDFYELESRLTQMEEAIGGTIEWEDE